MIREDVINGIVNRSKVDLKGQKLFNHLVNTIYVPLTVAYGVGVDSTAMLVEMHKRGIRPDSIIFSDVGSEKSETYAYLPIMQDWLRQVGFPPVITVRRGRGRTNYDSLHGECLANGTLPAISVGMKSCSMKWKAEPFNRFMQNWGPAKLVWEQGSKIVKAIGFDAGPNDGRRALQSNGEPRLEDERYYLWYPLIEWGYDREACKEIIRAAGLPVPVKSACFMCGAMRGSEIELLQRTHPELLQIALDIEDKARPRLTRFPKYGLNRQFSWRQYLLLKQRQTSFLDLLDKPDNGRTSLTVAPSLSDCSFVCPG